MNLPSYADMKLPPLNLASTAVILKAFIFMDLKFLQLGKLFVDCTQERKRENFNT